MIKSYFVFKDSRTINRKKELEILFHPLALVITFTHVQVTDAVIV